MCSFARILDVGTSFFQLIEATDPAKLITFSSHSMSFKALVDVDYWTVEMIAEDSGIFWKHKNRISWESRKPSSRSISFPGSLTGYPVMPEPGILPNARVTAAPASFSGKLPWLSRPGVFPTKS